MTGNDCTIAIMGAITFCESKIDLREGIYPCISEPSKPILHHNTFCDVWNNLSIPKSASREVTGAGVIYSAMHLLYNARFSKLINGIKNESFQVVSENDPT